MKRVTLTMTFEAPDNADLDEIVEENLPTATFSSTDKIVDERNRPIGTSTVVVTPI